MPCNTLIEPASAGTDWWKTVFSSAPVSDYNLDVRGGGDANAYAVSFNYFDQQGTAAFNDYRRGSVRVNTSFNRSKLNFGENIALTVDRHYGGTGTFDDASGENGVLGKDILIQPIVSVYDISGVNFAGAKGVPGVNSSNPLKNAWDARDNINKNNQVFGNVFGGMDVTPQFSLKSRLGFNLQELSFAGFSAPTDIFTTSPTFPTKEAADAWAQAKIGSGTSNYVVFNPDLIDIVRKYGLGGAAVGASQLVPVDHDPFGVPQ